MEMFAVFLNRYTLYFLDFMLLHLLADFCISNVKFCLPAFYTFINKLDMIIYRPHLLEGYSGKFLYVASMINVYMYFFCKYFSTYIRCRTLIQCI
jgi:hypothetical protein